jgi:hypothetical protein
MATHYDLRKNPGVQIIYNNGVAMIIFLCQISNEAEDRCCKALMPFRMFILAKYPIYKYSIFYCGSRGTIDG